MGTVIRKLKQMIRARKSAGAVKFRHELTAEQEAALRRMRAGFQYADQWQDRRESRQTQLKEVNPLREFFQNRTRGRGIWKWDHYFEIYHRHLNKFRHRPVRLLEIGVFSGGSLDMWRAYFGEQAHVIGVDIEPACRIYESNNTTILVGDQEDRQFWRRSKFRIGSPDILIDDGGHEPDQQIVTLEELLPCLRPGGVFICEDIHGVNNDFTNYMHGLAAQLNSYSGGPAEVERIPTEFQASISSITFYPFLVVVEKCLDPLKTLVAERHGSEWQPFL